MEGQSGITVGNAEGNAYPVSEAAPAWVAPAGLGALPPYLEQRVRDILARQRVEIGRLEDEQRTVGRHLEMLRSVPPVRGGGQPVYLDVTG